MKSKKQNYNFSCLQFNNINTKPENIPKYTLTT